VVWTLIQEGQALYALRPLHTFVVPVLEQLANFLYDQSRPEQDKDGNANPNRSERISVAGRILGDITLYNGQQVPVLDVSLRALFNWNLKFLIEGVLGSREHAPDKDAWDEDFGRLTNFLERIYYEVRNLGQAPSDRAINYLTTNLFQANEAFKNALKAKLELDSIFAEKSPLCRPKSDCWDVVMRFFDPDQRLQKALVEYRLTVDVSDISPVGIGKVRKWSRFA
jgi:cyanobactin maturation PatA/PatG family protease